MSTETHIARCTAHVLSWLASTALLQHDGCNPRSAASARALALRPPRALQAPHLWDGCQADVEPRLRWEMTTTGQIRHVESGYCLHTRNAASANNTGRESGWCVCVGWRGGRR